MCVTVPGVFMFQGEEEEEEEEPFSLLSAPPGAVSKARPCSAWE